MMKSYVNVGFRLAVFAAILVTAVAAQAAVTGSQAAAVAPETSSSSVSAPSPVESMGATLTLPTLFGPSEPAQPPPPDQSLIQRLEQETGARVEVSTRRGTGMVSFLRLEGDADLPSRQRSLPPEARSLDFLTKYGGLFGIRDAASELVPVGGLTDAQGGVHLSYQQMYQGVPVFGGMLRAHFDSQNSLRSVNGVFIPDIQVDPVPTLSEAEAAANAVAQVLANPPQDEAGSLLQLAPGDLQTASTSLFVYQDGLLQGLAGPVYLVYQVEVTNDNSVREFVFINAHTGEVVNRYSGVQQALFRRVHQDTFGNLVWEEGDPFPGSLNQNQVNIVDYSGDTYYFFFNSFGMDSYNGAGAAMQAVSFSFACGNASWDGTSTNYCNGMASDDVVGHEWGHAYTDYTHELIYEWQSGALNESYSDIWGEVIDMLNGKGTDSPAPLRTAGTCSIYSSPNPDLTIHSPPSIAGTYPGRRALFGPPLTDTGTTGNVVLADDGTGTPSDACEPLVNGADIAGNIALIDRGGDCSFVTKVKNAQNVGAIGVIVANTEDELGPLPGDDPTITIPTILVTLSTGNLIKSELSNGVNVTMARRGGPPEDSYRWLIGEDATASGNAIRDMWNPTCRDNPGKVTDEQYQCSRQDNGGVHTNSGIPNHGFALLVDGGTYNGHTVNAIGLTKAAHIYFRAMAVYQTRISDFADHADALEASCQDLIGVELEGLTTSPTPAGPSGEVINQADCDAVSEMTEAVELRVHPAPICGFSTLLAKDPPALCAGTQHPLFTLFFDDFESGLGNWTLTNEGVFSGWPGLDWTQATMLPNDRSGAAAHGPEPNTGTCGVNSQDISGVMRMESPDIVIPRFGDGSARLAFDHYVATEQRVDGGNLKISINGGPFEVVQLAFLYNPYNVNLTSSAINTNPLAGQRAFSGTDSFLSRGSWGQSQVDLLALGVQPGDTIRLRYDMGMNGCTGMEGWYVDDVHVYTCTSNFSPSVEVVSTGVCQPDNPGGTITLAVSDPEGDDVTLEATSSNQELISDGNITLSGSGNTRTLSFTAALGRTGVAEIIITASDGQDSSQAVVTVFVGGNDIQTIDGTSGPDIIYGLNGDDVLNGNGGNDLICGGNGADRLFGGEGDDTLTGGLGPDFFSGGPGTDIATDLGPPDTTDGTIP